MRKFGWRVPCLCGFWLVIGSCGGSDGRPMQPQPLMITSAVPPQAALKEDYGGRKGVSVTATGGVPPYRWTWAAAAGSTLPPGLKLSSNSDGTGTILGTPAKTGPYGVIVTVTDSESPAVQKSETYIITVAASSPPSQAATSGGSGPDLDYETSGWPTGTNRSSHDRRKAHGQYNKLACDTKEESSMIKNTVRFTVDLTINEGKFDEFEGIARAMIVGTQKEPGALGYDWYLSGDRRRCRILETYADADAVLAHLAGPVVQEFVPKILGASSISRFEVYGDPGPKAAQMLAGFGAQIFELWHGLSR